MSWVCHKQGKVLRPQCMKTLCAGRLKAMSTNQASLRGVTKDGDSLPTELLEEYTESGRRRRRDQGYKRETVSKGWTEKEETLFLEALELYGREWHKAAAHVGKL